MAQKQVEMEQLKQILKLKNEGVGIREISRCIGISRKSVIKYLEELNKDGIDYMNNKQIAEADYRGEAIQRDSVRQEQLQKHLNIAKIDPPKTAVTRNFFWKCNHPSLKW